MKKVMIVLVWLFCEFLTWGVSLGCFTHRYPSSNHTGICALLTVLGPCGLIASSISSVVSSGHIYWRVVPMTKEERWGAFHKRWPSLSRQEFEDNE